MSLGLVIVASAFVLSTVAVGGSAAVVGGIMAVDAIKKNRSKHTEALNNSSETNNELVNNDSLIIQTRMADEELLTEALKEYSKTLSSDEQNIFSNEGDKTMKFHFNKEHGNFEVITNNFPRDEAMKHINNLFNICSSLVQKKVYNRILNKLNETDEMTLDNEEVLEDDSIILTVGVNG